MPRNCLGTAGEQLRQLLFSSSPQPSLRSTRGRELSFGQALAVTLGLVFAHLTLPAGLWAAETTEVPDGMVVKAVLKAEGAGENLLKSEGWRPWSLGCERRDGEFVCDNGGEATAQRGISQSITLNQQQPEPIVASVWSKAEGVTGSADSDYALYLDLVFEDGTPLWGQTAAFATGTHDWQHRELIVLPEKPVRSLSYYLLLRRHGGRAWFRAPDLRVVQTPSGAGLFDGVPVVPRGPIGEGFQIRDVAAGSDFVRLQRETAGLKLAWTITERTSGHDGHTVKQARAAGRPHDPQVRGAEPSPAAVAA